MTWREITLGCFHCTERAAATGDNTTTTTVIGVISGGATSPSRLFGDAWKGGSVERRQLHALD
ncbi:hypothetical protein SESBI_48239 [Sesbania bispinosa]|nr:hypothetical protein SESBI_48239 [Sesbania bispinosa]